MKQVIEASVKALGILLWVFIGGVHTCWGIFFNLVVLTIRSDTRLLGHIVFWQVMFHVLGHAS